MISLSKRLRMAAELVPRCGLLADVGTDHAYLPVWLVQNQVSQRVLASDIGQGPLRRARETVEFYDLTDRVETILADGLNYPQAEHAEVVTICGMGGETMISVLQAAPWTREGRRIVLQPQSKLPELEAWLQAHEYAVTAAKLCLDGGKLYLAMAVQGGGTWEQGAEAWLCSGRDSLFPVYLRRELDKTERALSGLRQAQTEHAAALAAIERRLAALKDFEREVKAW